MSNDHPKVASRAASEPGLNRYHELLDREILPCLERPGRHIGPFEVRGFATEGAEAERLSLLWPSVPESHYIPRELAPIRQALERRLRTPLEFACAPAPECAARLSASHLPYFSRPGWLPLARFSQLALWLEDPLQVFGLLSILEAAGLPLRSQERGGAPPVWAGGPAVASLAPLLESWVDRQIPTADPEAYAEALAQAKPEASRASDSTPSADLSLAPDPKDPRRFECGDVGVGKTRARSLLRAQLSRPLCEVDPGFAGARSTRMYLFAANSRLRASLGLSGEDEVRAALREALAHESRQLTLHLAVGLPRESAEDRAAIGELLGQVVRIAPRGARQIQLVLRPYLGDSSEESHSPAQLARWSAAVEERARSLRLKAEFPSEAALRLSSWIMTCGAEAATQVESFHAAGLRHGDEDGVLLRFVRKHGIPEESSLVSAAAEPAPVAAAPEPTGLEGVAPLPPSLDANGHPLDSGQSSHTQQKPDRWQRWNALVPREYPLRLIFEKSGRARHLSHRETSDLLVEAFRRGGLPLAIAGVVSPRPKLSFGPSLPVGVVGLHEFVDLSLTRKPTEILSSINEHLPEGILVRAARYLPPGARKALLPVERAHYRALIPPSQVDAVREGLRRFSAESSWEIERVKGEKVTRIELKAQVTNIDLRVIESKAAELRFDLALDAEGARPRAREFLASVLGVDCDDVRTITLSRECLLSRGGQILGSWKTPLELVDLAVRRSRQAIKRNT
ncbi:MAG TPA: TIGR03936 family radical SAM-associated protein [Candidatus Krumholzibacteria bacterium]|nr:TIGR03936 family radical SAM-associated protein [Candidatus Krumholzibacteria bacterium]